LPEIPHNPKTFFSCYGNPTANYTCNSIIISHNFAPKHFMKLWSKVQTSHLA
jgi:hypothetical protein